MKCQEISLAESIKWVKESMTFKSLSEKLCMIQERKSRLLEKNDLMIALFILISPFTYFCSIQKKHKKHINLSILRTQACQISSSVNQASVFELHSQGQFKIKIFAELISINKYLYFIFKVQKIISLKMRKNTTLTKSKIITFNIQDYQRPGVSIDEIAQLKQAFDLFDVNGTGVINSKQLKASMYAQGFQQSSPTLYNIISDLVNSNTNTLDFSSFLDITTASSGVKITKKSVRKVFSLFDDEKAGFVSTKNLKRLTRQLNLDISENELQVMIDRADIDRDGLVSEQEFYLIMSK